MNWMICKLESARVPTRIATPGRHGVVWALLFWLGMSLAVWGAETPSRPILVLASFHPRAGTEQEQIDGMLSVLSPETHIFFEYLDTEQFGRRSNFIQYYEGVLFAKYKTARFAAIVALNNGAIRVVKQVQNQLFPGIPLIVCGSSPKVMGRELANWTGVFSEPDIEQTIRGALAVHPTVRKVHALTDSSSLGRSVNLQLKGLEAAGKIPVALQLTEEDWAWKSDDLMKLVRELPVGDLLLYGHLYREIGGEIINPRYLVQRMADEATVPIYTINRETIGAGAVGGYVVNGQQIGKSIGEMVVRVLAGESTADIPPKILAGEWLFDDVQLKRWGIQDRALPPGCRIINRPIGFFEQHKWVLLIGSLIVWVESTIIALLLINRAGRIRAQRALQTSEKRYRGLFEVSEDLFLIMDVNGRLAHANPAACRLLGYSLGELIGRDQVEMVVPEDRAVVRDRLDLALGGAWTVLEARCLTRSGEEFPVEFLFQPFQSDGATLVVCFARNLTERIKLQRLAQEISERERQNMGYDIHDGLGQYLTALRFQCHRLEQEAAARAPMDPADIAKLSRIVAELAFEIRGLARSLVPLQMLSRTLQSALQELVEINRRHFHVEASLEFMLDEERLLPDVAAQLYRIAQEAMRNAVRHAGATTVRVVLREASATEAELSVENDGAPFERLPEHRAGMGLAIMEQRTRLIRGHWTIRATAENRTRVECRIPLLAEGAKDTP